MANETQELIRSLGDLNNVMRSSTGGFEGITRRMGNFGIAVTTTTAALAILTREIGRSIERARQFTDFRLSSGPGQAAAAQATALLGALGISGGRQGALAAGIRDAIAAGGQARGAAAQLGVGNVLPRGLGGPSDVDVLLKLSEGIRRVTSEQEAYNLAVRLGAPELLRFRLLGDQQIGNIRRLGEEIKRTFSPEAQARLARFQADWEVAQTRILLGIFKIFDDLILKPRYGPDNELSQALKNLDQAMNANTSAVQSNTVAINQNRQVFGGGANARGAFPAGLRGELLRRQMEGERIKLGAFAL